MASKVQKNPITHPVNYMTSDTSLWSMLKTIVTANANAAVQASLTMESAASACNRVTGLVHNEISVIESQQDIRLEEKRKELQMLIQ